MNLNASQIIIINPQTGGLISQISLDEEQFQANNVISTSGSLQGFTILSGIDELRNAWFNKKTVLLRTDKVQQHVKIATFPTLGENHGYLETIPETRINFDNEEELTKPRFQIRRGFALLQTLIST